jgi:hypothetical protein
MKKILGILVIAGALVACNNDADDNSTEDTVATSTSTSTTIDSNLTTGGDTLTVSKDSVTTTVDSVKH